MVCLIITWSDFLIANVKSKGSSFAALVTQLLERIRREIFKYGKVEPPVNFTVIWWAFWKQYPRLLLKFYIQKIVFKSGWNGVFVGAIWQQCFPWARSFLNRKKAYYNFRKKERHSHHLIIFNYLVHPCRIFTKMVNEIKLMKTKMSQTECPSDKEGQCI